MIYLSMVIDDLNIYQLRRVISPLPIPVDLLVVSDKIFWERLDPPGNIF